MRTDFRPLASAILVSLISSPALAGESATINLTGVQLKNNTNQSRTSAPEFVDPAPRYTYKVVGLMKGNSGIFQVLYPNPTPIATILETLAPGSSAALEGAINNPTGTHPYVIVNSTQSGTTELLGITATFAATLKVEIDAGGVVGFSLTDVTISPSVLLGSMSFSSGTAVVTRVACASDFDADGFVTGDDFDAFVLDFLTGSPTTDFNADGFVTGDDFDAFVSAFVVGC
jgi:hypothetical protein